MGFAVCVTGCLCLSQMRIMQPACSVTPLMFRQVLDGFEQEILNTEELGLSQPTSCATVFKTSQKELNPSPPTSESSSDTHKRSSCAASHTETEAASVPLTAVGSPSFPDAESAFSAPLSSASQPCLVSVPSPSNISTLPAENDSCTLQQSQSDPCICHTNEVTVPLSEVGSVESHSAQVEDLSLKLIATHTSLETHEVQTIQVLTSLSDSVV